MQTPETGLDRETWKAGRTHDGPNEPPVITQDDLAVLGGVLGFRPDDYSDVVPFGYSLPPSGSARLDGLINGPADRDLFRSTLSSGRQWRSVTVSVDEYASNLDIRLRVLDPLGRVFSTSAPADRLGASITVPAGLWYVEVSSPGAGEAGRYTLTSWVYTPLFSSATSLTPEVLGAAIAPKAAEAVPLPEAPRMTPAASPVPVSTAVPPVVVEPPTVVSIARATPKRPTVVDGLFLSPGW